MHPSTPSDAAVGTLLAGGRLVSGKVQVGPLSPNATRLLRVLWAGRDDFARKKGVDQAASLRAAFLKAGEEEQSVALPTAEPAPGGTGSDGAELAARTRWRLHRLRCCSFRGVAPLGTEFEFAFDGHPTLVYGPNGSGKSSLINAIGWVLAGRVVIDSDDHAEKIPVYAAPKPGAARAAKLCDWPLVHTLPHAGDPATTAQDCWAELLLKSDDGSRSLHLRRRHGGPLEESEDGAAWRECASLG